MRSLGYLFSVLLSFPILAGTTVTTKVYDIDYGSVGEEVLVLLETGKVARLLPQDKGMIDNVITQKGKDQWYTFELDDNRFITSVKETENPYPVSNEPMLFDEKNNYVPTTVESMAKAKEYHRSGRRTVKEETQCFNRAMVWTYEWWKNHSLKSMKILIFFTRNYIRRYNFEWWFHIAPYLHIKQDDGSVKEFAMDLKYTSRPLPFREWTNIFMRNDAECPVITKYSEYADHPYTGECYIFRTHMYTYQPADLQMYEAWNYSKNAFVIEEVKGAYLEAYDIHL